MPSRRNALAREVRAVQGALLQLARAFGRLGPALAAVPAMSPAAVGAPRARRKLKLSPARRAALKLQGQYMGYMRTLKPAQKKKVKQIREKKGIRVAIAAARRLH